MNELATARGDANSVASYSQLPQGWAEARCVDIGTWTTGGTPSRKNPHYFGGNIPWVKSGDLCDGCIVATDEWITEEGLKNCAAKLLPASTVIMALYGATIGKLGILSFEAATNQACASCRVDERLADRKYLFYYLLSQRQQLIEAGQGGAQPNLTNELVRNWKIPLPPLAEQRRIVAKVEELLARVNAARERLAKVPAILKRFRQSVLAAACSGQLTADWRSSNSPQQPWSHRRVEDVADVLGGHAYKSKSFAKEGANQVLRIGNVRASGIDRSVSPVYIDGSLAEETNRFALNAYDIVVSMTGTRYKRDYGFPAIVWREDSKLFVNQRLVRVRCGIDVNPRMVLYWMQSDSFRNHFFSGETGNVNQGNVGVDGVRKAPISVPSLAEQHEIGRRVEAIFGFIERVVTRLTETNYLVGKSIPVILSRAFRGELVPTEADLARLEGRDYEPASVLLERIRDERAAAGNGAHSNTSAGKRATRTPKKDENSVVADTLGDGSAGKIGRGAQRSTNNHDGPTESDGNLTAPSKNGAPTEPIGSTDRDDVMAVIREVFSSGGVRSRPEAIKEISAALGHGRAGSRIAETLDKDIRAAVRRGILENDGAGLRLLCRSIADYDPDFLMEQLQAGMGAGWWDRGNLIESTARWLGFRRTGPIIRATLKSALSTALRRGLLESNGPRIRRRR